MSESFLLLDGYEALGTKWYIEVFEAIELQKQEAVRSDVENLLTSFGVTYSRFNPNSLLNELNTKRSVRYDACLADMLLLGEEAYVTSKGVFNLFVKDALEKKGYGSNGVTESVVVPRTSLDTTKKRVTITEESITLMCDGSIDLGGIGKEYLIDYLAEHLKDTYGVQQFLINGGGDMYATHNNGDAIEVYMEHPENQGEMIGSLLLKNQAFCSSSSFVRMWKDGDVSRNHFVSQDGCEVWAASYVVGANASYTGIVATIACIASADTSFCEMVSAHYSSECAVYMSGSLIGNLVYTPVS